MTEDTWATEDPKATWADEIKRAWIKNTERVLQDLIDGSTDLDKEMNIGIAIAILVGELQRQNKRIEALEEMMRE